MCTTPSLCLVIEYMEGGSLLDFIMSDQEISLQTLAQITRGCAAGIAYLHKENCTHRDIAARNILLSENLVPKISDFGLARVVEGDDSKVTETSVGPLRWMSPESIRDRIYSKKSDVWSFGILLIEIYGRDTPFPDLRPVEVANLTAHYELHPTAPSEAPKIIHVLVEQCCRYEPVSRPDFSEICQKLESDSLYL